MAVTDRIGPFAAGRTLGIPGNGSEDACTAELWRDFVPEVNLPLLGVRRLKVLALASRSFPRSRELHFGPSLSRRWAVYFCYAPDGIARACHRFTIDRLREEGFAIMCVCATADPEQATGFLQLGVDALIWKELRGYDFSGYSLGLEALAQRFDDIDVLVLNDSVLGPLHPVRPCLDSSPWGLTGFMTSYSVEHHIQSFAFYFKGFGRRTFRAARRVFFRKISFNSQGPVSLLQETRLASALSGVMTVGSILTPSISLKDGYYLLGNPAGLVEAGFPFIKRSIFTKFADGYDQQFYRDFLEAQGHPDSSAPA
jgi:hypothetical protein